MKNKPGLKGNDRLPATAHAKVQLRGESGLYFEYPEAKQIK
jgi:hypothetical protein